MSASTALVELVRDALKDPSIRDEIKAIISTEEGDLSMPVPANEPMIDAHAAAGCWA
jgi:hypothetical protein